MAGRLAGRGFISSSAASFIVVKSRTIPRVNSYPIPGIVPQNDGQEVRAQHGRYRYRLSRFVIVLVDVLFRILFFL